MVSNKVTFKKLTLQKNKTSTSIINKQENMLQPSNKKGMDFKKIRDIKEVFKININILKWKSQQKG